MLFYSVFLKGFVDEYLMCQSRVVQSLFLSLERRLSLLPGHVTEVELALLFCYFSTDVELSHVALDAAACQFTKFTSSGAGYQDVEVILLQN